MGNDRPRWRIRLSTLMLLVVIAALAAALVMERRRSAMLEVEKEATRASDAEGRARMRAVEAMLASQIARDQAAAADREATKAKTR